jgi:hypothetical protein
LASGSLLFSCVVVLWRKLDNLIGPRLHVPNAVATFLNLNMLRKMIPGVEKGINRRSEFVCRPLFFLKRKLQARKNGELLNVGGAQWILHNY